MKERVVVGMSGGLDSSVAAALLKKKGYEVIGVTLCLDSYSERNNPDSLICVADSRRVARKLGIKHYVLDLTGDFRKKVTRDFLREYRQGRTPNPCIRCNRHIKFEALFKKASSLGARFVATGHYCRIAEVRQLNRRNYFLKKAKDKTKDQSYFLYRLKQNRIKQILFPLGDYTKAEVRAMAKKLSLSVFDRPESQDICFLRGTDYREFLRKRLKRSPRPGLIIDRQGKILGVHQGIPFYTVGQRQGLGIALGYPAYVSAIDAKKNRIILGKKEDCYRREFMLKEPYFISGLLKKRIALGVRIRYNHPEAKATIFTQGKRIRVRFARPQFAIAPGQSAVFYEGDRVSGGGTIDEVLN
jgi:tRNA-specific 2-thiouridylase